jgi:CheY-like chemotaxis protein
MTHVLVVDDAAHVRELFGRVLQNEGMDVALAADGARGLALARARIPDLVVADLKMPHLDGVQLCRALRSDPATEHVPIVIVTGQGGAQARAAIEAGCDAVLEKPCSSALLVATINILLARRQRPIADPNEPA